MRSGRQGFGLLLNVGRIVPFHGFFQLFKSLLDILASLFVNLIAMLLEGFFGGIDHAVSLITHLDEFLFLFVLVSMGLSILDHLIDLFVAKTGGSSNADRLFLTGTEILGGNMQDSVGVDVEGNLNLRYASGSGGNTDQLKTTDGLVTFRHFPLTLQHVNRYRRLIVGRGGEDLALLARDSGVFFDEFGHHRTEGFDTQRQRRNVEQQYVFDVALENSTLNRGADSDHFIGIDSLIRCLVEYLLDLALHRRHTRHATDQQHFVDIRSR